MSKKVFRCPEIYTNLIAIYKPYVQILLARNPQPTEVRF